MRGFKIGDRVSGEGHIACGFCRNCRAGRRHLCRNTVGVGVNREGAFAEYLVIPAFNAFKIPDDISDDLASIFDPFGNATHTALSFNLVGEDVLITGAGPIGIMAAAIARHVGARYVVITDVNDYRLDLARRMGATRAVNVRREKLRDVMDELGMTEGFDVGMEMSGMPEAFARCYAYESRWQGRAARHPAVAHGDRLEPGDLQGPHIKGIYGREMFETWYKMVAMLQSGLDLSPIITHHYPAEDYEAAFATMISGQSGKVILGLGRVAPVGLAPALGDHLPMQNRLKMAPSKSSAVCAPVISPSASCSLSQVLCA